MIDKKNIAAICVWFIYSCNTFQQPLEKTYEYSDDFKYYLNHTFKANVKFKSHYFIIPLSSCEACVDSALTNIAKNKFNDWQIIFVGSTTDSLRNILINKIKLNQITFSDEASHLFEYSVGIGMPSLITLENDVNSSRLIEFSSDYWQIFNKLE